MQFFPGIRSTALLATSLLLVNTNTAAAPTPNGRLLASQCFQCHNAKGGSTGFDSITGESVNEIYGELKEMQAKAAREPAIMHSQALIYKDNEIRALAKYLSTLPKSQND